MMLAIRISGQVEISSSVKEALFRMRLRRKYTATILDETPENMKILESLRSFIAFGKIDSKLLEEIISKRGKPLPGKKLDIKKAAELIEKKGILESGIKPFFRLHPPRKGIDSKLHFPKGVLGDNKDKIGDLVRRML